MLGQSRGKRLMHGCAKQMLGQKFIALGNFQYLGWRKRTAFSPDGFRRYTQISIPFKWPPMGSHGIIPFRRNARR